MARRVGKKIKVYVELNNNLKYGFYGQESIYDTYHAKTGQTKIIATTKGVFLGANFPKPSRATKYKDSTGDTDSTFVSDNKIASLRAEGWVIKNFTGSRGIGSTRRTIVVYVQMPTAYKHKHAWYLDKQTFAAHGAILGIKAATSEDLDTMVFGATPLPPRATLNRDIGNLPTISTFIQPKDSVKAAAEKAGWSVSNVKYDIDTGT